MTKRMFNVSFAAFVLFISLIGWVVANRAASKVAPTQRSEFAQQIDLTPLKSIAVYDQGTIKSFDSFASSMMHLISGPHKGRSEPPTAESPEELLFGPRRKDGWRR